MKRRGPLPRCAGCDTPIRSKADYRFFDGEDWCSLCYEAVKDMPTTKAVSGRASGR